MDVVPPNVRSTGEVKKRLVRYLQKFGARYRLGAHGVRAHVSTGNAPNEICALARKIDADLIIASTHGHTGWKHVLLGSVAERLVRHAPCPVLIARRGETTRAEKTGVAQLVVPIDFSPSASLGLAYAVKFARKFGSSLVLLHVVTPEHFTVPQGALAYATPELKQRAVDDARARLKKFAAKVDFEGVTWKEVVRAGIPHVEICRFEDKSASDLVITSTHGRTGLRHALLGSVAEHVVRSAHGPVLVVPTRRGTKA
jgi:nucleotide-binding universal stress UspA family protein